MDIKIKELVDLYENLYEDIKDCNFNIRVAYKFSVLFKKAAEERDFYYAQIRKIIEKYSEKDENGKAVTTDDGRSVKIKDGFVEKCNDELKELYELEVKCPEISFSFEELESEKISVDKVGYLIGFIKETSEA